MRSLLCVTLFAFVVLNFGSYAATIYVDASKTGGANNGLAWADAWGNDAPLNYQHTSSTFMLKK